MPGTRIAISEKGRVAKLIIIPFRDGGVAVSAPYTKDRKGLLVAMKPSEQLGRTMITADALTAEYSAGDRVKLSMHRDGFAQFSGTGIRSGKDEDGEPKGLAIQMRRPFMYPIRTGPTFGITVWDLDGFETLRKRDADRALVFDEQDFLYRGASPDHWDGYLVETFVFPGNLLRYVEPRGLGKSVLPYFHPGFQGRGAHFNFRVMTLPNQSVFLGFLVSRMQGVPLRSDGSVSSGFVLGGPRAYDGVGLYAIYPTPYAKGEGRQRLSIGSLRTESPSGARHPEEIASAKTPRPTQRERHGSKDRRTGCYRSCDRFRQPRPSVALSLRRD